MGDGISGLGWMQGAGSLLQAFGLLQGGEAAAEQGIAARVAAEFNQRQAERQANLAIAIGQHSAEEIYRQDNLMASRALAVAAASGGGASDPTIVRLIAKGRQYGAYKAHVAMYEGEAHARELRIQGILGMASGYGTEAAGYGRQAGSYLAAGGAVARGMATAYSNDLKSRNLFEKYGAGGPGEILDTGSQDMWTTG